MSKNAFKTAVLLGGSPAMSPATERLDAAVVLAVADDSVAAVAVARAAGEAALTCGREVVLFTVAGAHPEYRGPAGLGWIDGPGSVADDADATFGRVRPMLDRLGVSYRTRVDSSVVGGGRWGRGRQIAREIQRAAEGEAAALVVIGHPSGRRRARSSVARRILRRTTCDVLVVPVTTASSPARDTPTANPGRHDIPRVS